MITLNNPNFALHAKIFLFLEIYNYIKNTTIKCKVRVKNMIIAKKLIFGNISMNIKFRFGKKKCYLIYKNNLRFT